MPRVRGRDFAYTPEGRAAARAYSQQSPSFRTPDSPPNVYRDTTQAILDRRRSHEIPAKKVWAEDVDREHLDTVRQEVRDAFNQLPPDARRDPATRQRLLEELSSRARDRRRASRSHDEYGRFGYAGETERQHEDRLWDRDWDEDWRGRKWDPRNSRA